MRALFFLLTAASIAAMPTSVHAEPVVPRDDAQVIETLPAVSGSRAEDRALRRAWAAQPSNAALAVQLSRRYMAQAHEAGDPRYAGMALAALAAWPDTDRAPDDVMLATATVQQYLHAFDPAAHTLETLVGRNPAQAQAWLTLATVRRVQGRYAASDAACDALTRAGAALYAQACAAENASLRGDAAAAREKLTRLSASPLVPAETRNWLLTTLAEVEARAGRPAEAEAAYRDALQAHADAYTTLSYADFLLNLGRDADAAAQLAAQVRTDAVLLRLAIIGARSKTPEGLRDVREVRERMAQANQRPDARTTHAREQAMFALWVDMQPARALELARLNVRHQREPLDILLLAQAAQAAHSAEGRREVEQLCAEIGYHDERLHAYL